MPRVHGEATAARYPLLRYDWARTRAALQALAQDRTREAPVEVAYVNPETGRDCLNTIGFSALWLRPGETQSLARISAARVFHVVEGAGDAEIEGATIRLDTADTLCVPGFARVRLANASARAPLALICADESPIHRKLGIFEVRGDDDASRLPETE